MEDLLIASNATSLSVYEGKQYRTGWYSVPLLWVYNKDMFDKAGLDADTPPATWDDFLAACDKLKTANFTPLTAGLKDGPWGEWYMGHGLGQNLDSPADALNLFAGSSDWREPKNYEAWSKLADLWKAGFFNDDMNSIDLYPGIDLFSTGKGAMTQIVGPLVPNAQEQLGAENVGVMTFPVFGSGAMAGRPIFDTQGLGISAQSANKEVAADFLTFLHSDERVNAIWDEVKQFPTDATWDGSKVEDGSLRQIWETWVNGPHVPVHLEPDADPVLDRCDVRRTRRRSSPASSPASRPATTRSRSPRSGRSRTRICSRTNSGGRGPRTSSCWQAGPRTVARGLLTDQVALVTGAGQGLGATIAREFADEGATVALLERNPEIRSRRRNGRSRPPAAASSHTNWISPTTSATRKSWPRCVAETGRIDIQVNNAAITRYGTILTDTLEDWRAQIAVNLEAVYMGTKLVVPHMVERGYGRVISITSIQGFASSGDAGPYNAAKGGIIAYTKSMAVELAPYGIAANAIAPGFMRTPMSFIDGVDETTTDDFKTWYVDRRKVPMARTGLPEDVSGAAVFLASDYCRYMTGQVLVVDGGLMSTF